MFASPIALDDYGDRALERAESMREGGLTVHAATRLAESTPGSGERVWTLTAHESQILVSWIASYQGGRFSAHINRELDHALNDPSLQRLVDYLQRAPRLAQYVVRLCSKPENSRVRSSLRERITDAPDAHTRLPLLPKGLQRILLKSPTDTDM